MKRAFLLISFIFFIVNVNSQIERSRFKFDNIYKNVYKNNLSRCTDRESGNVTYILMLRDMQYRTIDEMIDFDLGSKSEALNILKSLHEAFDVLQKNETAKVGGIFTVTKMQGYLLVHGKGNSRCELMKKPISAMIKKIEQEK